MEQITLPVIRQRMANTMIANGTDTEIIFPGLMPDPAGAMRSAIAAFAFLVGFVHKFINTMT